MGIGWSVTHIHKYSDVSLATTAKRKVAAYARVSTDDEDQQTSYAAQCDYYERYIKSREDWEFVKVYADEGISGCNIRKRESFQAMVRDALDGKIDLIIAKSLSRFSRNTVDSLTTIRKQSHPAIIDPAVFEMVQRETERRSREGRRYIYSTTATIFLSDTIASKMPTSLPEIK